MGGRTPDLMAAVEHHSVLAILLALKSLYAIVRKIMNREGDSRLFRTGVRAHNRDRIGREIRDSYTSLGHLLRISISQPTARHGSGALGHPSSPTLAAI